MPALLLQDVTVTLDNNQLKPLCYKYVNDLRTPRDTYIIRNVCTSTQIEQPTRNIPARSRRRTVRRWSCTFRHVSTVSRRTGCRADS